MSSPAVPKTILFLGATGGCGLSALRHSLAAGHTCIALQRTPSKLTALLSDKEQNAAIIQQGNAHDVAAVSRALANPNRESALVDSIIFSIGGAFSWSLSNFGVDDWNVCEKGMTTVLEALAKCRAEGLTGRPRIVGISSTGVTRLGRDVPLAIVPLYHGLLKKPHQDKRKMEELLAGSGEDFTIIRASLLTDGNDGEKVVREGMEDPIAQKVESSAIGFSISRADVGKWIFDNVVEGKDGRKWVKKAATLTY